MQGVRVGNRTARCCVCALWPRQRWRVLELVQGTGNQASAVGHPCSCPAYRAHGSVFVAAQMGLWVPEARGCSQRARAEAPPRQDGSWGPHWGEHRLDRQGHPQGRPQASLGSDYEPQPPSPPAPRGPSCPQTSSPAAWRTNGKFWKNPGSKSGVAELLLSWTPEAEVRVATRGGASLLRALGKVGGWGHTLDSPQNRSTTHLSRWLWRS